MAYDVRFSPGGSSGRYRHGNVHRANLSRSLGNGGQTLATPSGMPSVYQRRDWRGFPTGGCVSIAGHRTARLLLDNTGPIARDVTDAAMPSV